MKKTYFLAFLLLFLVSACNSDLSEEERSALWDNAQTTGEIVRRSGTPFNTATDKDRALSDARNRLITGGGLFGDKADLNFFGDNESKTQKQPSIGMPINPYLWKASLETISFMPLSSTDPFAGTIITEWFTAENNIGERCKLNIFISGQDLKTKNLKVLSFCQSMKKNQWVNTPTNTDDNISLENAILNKAKKLKLTSG